MDRPPPRPTIIEAPSILGLRPTGVEELPQALLDASLAGCLEAKRRPRVDPPPYDEARDPVTKMLNPRGIATYTNRLADAICPILDEGGFPFVLGGDCSILLGCMLALRRRGPTRLLFLDGHADFYQPEANVNGEAASSELAFVTGRGPSVLTRFDGFCPLVDDKDVVAFGQRDQEEAKAYQSQPLPPGLLAMDLQEVRAAGVRHAADRAVDHLTRGDGRFWIHLDVDVLDDAIMPAVDYRMSGGLTWHELETVLRTATKSGRVIGMDVTIFNPRLDPDGAISGDLVRAIARGFGR